MNCSTHPEMAAVAFCRTCGKPLCADCRRVAEGTVYCSEHAPATGYSAPYANPVGPAGARHAGSHPAIAFILGWIPGVGAIYNGQYVKGLVHALIFGLLVSILNSNSAEGMEPLVGILLAAFVIYMPFEAYHTAGRREHGEQVDEFSSVLSPRDRRSSTGAVTLILAGVVFLMNTLGVLPLHRILRFWPVLLIALGVSMLHSRMSEAGSQQPPASDPNREVNR
jgi:Domain of unknown function (DUF5668)/B-box zinc finger